MSSEGPARDDLILSVLPIARSLSRRYKDAAGWLDWQDLLQEGMVGAMRALESYEERQGCSFGQYAGHYIRGAITHAIRDRNHRRPGLPLVTTTTDADVFEAGCTHDHPNHLADVIDRLPERERALIWLHYFGGLDLCEIAMRWGGTKYMGSHLHRQALARLRTMLEPSADSRTPTALERRRDR
jgi:RNA polymerase sigma factor (sigma-70 family)